MWINCSNYVDLQKQAWRLKNKEYDFDEWYRVNFRSEVKMGDVAVNG